MAINLFESIMKRLEDDKNNYKYVFYNPKKDNFILIKGYFSLYSSRNKFVAKYIDYSDGKMFGLHKKLSKVKDYEFICIL